MKSLCSDRSMVPVAVFGLRCLVRHWADGSPIRRMVGDLRGSVACLIHQLAGSRSLRNRRRQPVLHIRLAFCLNHWRQPARPPALEPIVHRRPRLTCLAVMAGTP